MGRTLPTGMPCTCSTVTPSPRKCSMATLPMATMISGWFISTSTSSQRLAQKSASCLLGVLLRSGLHLTTLEIITSVRFTPTLASRLSRYLPASPVKGLPNLSSFLPGASPTSITLPCPTAGTGALQPSLSGQALQSWLMS